MKEFIGREPVSITSKLRLRRFSLSDANGLMKIHQDQSMRRWLLDDIDLGNLELSTRFLYGLEKLYREHPGLGVWALECLESRYSREQLLEQGAFECLQPEALERLVAPEWKMQGWFNLNQIPDGTRDVELGFRLHSRAWGQRIACVVGQQLVDYAFDVVLVDSLYAHCHPSNHAALFCAAYLGFEAPTQINIQGANAIRLVARAGARVQSSAIGSSQRRREAVACMRQWAEQEFREGA